MVGVRVVTCAVTFFNAGPCSRASFGRGGGRFKCRVHCFGKRLGGGGILLARNISTIYVFIGSATSTRIVHALTTGNMGLLTLEYTKCGGISLSTTTSGKVAMLHIPTCSPCTMTRCAMTLVLSLGHGVPHTS